MMTPVLQGTDTAVRCRQAAVTVMPAVLADLPGWTSRAQPGAGIMEVDDRQVMTVFTVQPSSHHRHSTNRVSGCITSVDERRGEV